MGQKVQQRAFTNTFEGKYILDKNVPALYNNLFQQIVVIFSFSIFSLQNAGDW